MRNRIIWLLVFIILLFSTISFADETFEILRYEVNAKINNNAVIDIEEMINVSFKQQSHGIYRDIPTHYRGREQKISNIKVVDAKTNERIEYTVSKRNNIVRIKIGSADIAPNKMNYKISYSYDYGYKPDCINNSFYYHFIGNNWNAKIAKAKVNIEMPKRFDKEKINFFLGEYKFEKTKHVRHSVDGNRIEASAENLEPYEGLTFYINLPDDYFSNTSLLHNRMVLISIIVVLIIIVLIETFLLIKKRKPTSI